MFVDNIVYTFLMHRCRGVSMYDTLSVFSSNYAFHDLYGYNYTVKNLSLLLFVIINGINFVI